MLATLTFIALLYAVGFAVLAGALWRAPKGFEDERGFHRGHEPRN